MNRNKIKVGIVFGGQSAEHEVSKMTAESIIKNIDRKRFDLSEIYINKNGDFDEGLLDNIDIAFLAVHGHNCEDGKLQGYLEKKGIKYTGSGVEASALNMNKIKMHQKFQSAGLPTVEYLGFKKSAPIKNIKEKIAMKVGYSCFIKPNNGGSSLGMTKCDNEDRIEKAVKEARKYDDIIIIEKAVRKPREIEVAILGNNELTISEPGEILSGGEFYSYRKKYLKPFKTTVTPADLSKETIDKIKIMAVKAYRITGCRGYARVDFFLNSAGEIYLNEINTLPGFTKVSMFPQMIAAAGVNYRDLITKIILLGLNK